MLKKTGIIFCIMLFSLSAYAARPQTPAVPLPKPKGTNTNQQANSPSQNSNNELFHIETDPKGNIKATSKDTFRTSETYVVTGDSVLLDDKVYKKGEEIHSGAKIRKGTTFNFSQEN